MKPQIIFVKWGGAVITDKSKPEKVRLRVLQRLVGELARAQRELNLKIILGNGAGSFAHVPAAKYRTMEGFVDAQSGLGMAITQDSASRLNRLVVRTCLAAELPVFSLAPSAMLLTQKREARAFFLEVLTHQLDLGMLPVVFGDVVTDLAQGCTIWSTDRVFAFLARKLVERGHAVAQIIHVTQAHGVWRPGEDKKAHEADKKIYEKITQANLEEVKKAMVDVRGIDVTGGMWHKIETAIQLADLGIETRIISGLVPDALYRVLKGDKTIGTTVSYDKQ